MEEEDRYGGETSSRPPTREEILIDKKKQVKRILENDTELLNEIVVELRTEKIEKIRKK